jgi:spore coat polysaccharide biosynthesis protein SpsF (cytidylyltransferase family)
MIAAIIQARMGSSRLPGKVLMDICGQTMVERVIAAVKRSSHVDLVMVAIPDTQEDDELFRILKQRRHGVVRGSANDVLSRYFDAAQALSLSKTDSIVRITADCPLMMSSVIDHVCESHLRSSADYTSNVRPPTYPDGLDVEVFTFASLHDAVMNAKKESEREHVTPYIFASAKNSQNVERQQDLSDIRLTVDHQDDLDFVREYVARFGEVQLDHLRDQISLINDDRSHRRNEGYEKSLLSDQEKKCLLTKTRSGRRHLI